MSEEPSSRKVQGEEKQEERDASIMNALNEASTTTSTATTTQNEVSAPLPLDWTRVTPEEKEDHYDDDDHEEMPIRYPWDVATIDVNDDELVVVGTAGQKITKMGMDLSDKCNPKLKQLVLRSHLIQKMEGIAGFEQLELLELYDNMVEGLTCLNEGAGGAPGQTTLKILDMSYNSIRDMKPVSFCPHLRELYLANNKLKAIAGLGELKTLVKIDLGANRIRVIEGLSGLESLEELWLGKNKIEQISGLEKLTKLRRLDVQANRVTVIEGLETQVDTLEELYLSHNGITDEGASSPTGLSLPFTKLNTIDLSRNRLTAVTAFGHLGGCLEDLWLSGNEITTMDDVQALSSLTKLDSVYLEYNPLQQDPLYRKKLKELIPSLQQIDADMIQAVSGAGFTSNPGLPVETLEDQMRRLQNMAVQRAKRESGQDGE